MRIAIVGPGIAGLTCAHLLHRRHEITVFEAREQPGGHTLTLHVSPFLGMDNEYVCHASAPGPHLTVHVGNLRAGERVFDATLSLERRPPSQLRRLRIRYPAQTLRVLALIYGHAALLAGRGVANRTFAGHTPR